MDIKIYNELLRLRQKFKDEGKRMQGRAPLVCSDDALLEIAELCPKKLSDFESVPGIGKSFIENYGEAFLRIILKYEEVPTEKTVYMTTSASDTLKELEKKLVSINRRNRLLYMPKVANKYAFDLFAPHTDYLESIIAGNGSFVTICDLARTDNSDEQNELSRYKKLCSYCARSIKTSVTKVKMICILVIHLSSVGCLEKTLMFVLLWHYSP